MKISTEQLQALQRQTEIKAKGQRTDGGFDALLSEQLGSAAVPGTAAFGLTRASTAALGLGGVDPVLSADASPENDSLDAVAESLEAMLGGLDEYAGALSSPQGADLRKAYGILQDMDKSLTALREATPDLAKRHAGMASMLDEIAVITRTERVKMNRGDYF